MQRRCFIAQNVQFKTTAAPQINRTGEEMVIWKFLYYERAEVNHPLHATDFFGGARSAGKPETINSVLR